MTWVRESQPTEHAAATTKTLLLRLGVPFDDARVRDDLESDPDYPSFAAIASALASWQIEADGFEVDPEALDEIATPFIAHMAGERFWVVTALGPDRVAYVDTGLGAAEIARETFLRGWTGRVLVAKPSRTASARTRNETRVPWRAVLGSVAVAAYALTGFMSGALFAATVAWIGIAVVGLGLSGLLVAAELGDNALTRKLCSSAKRLSCDAVMTSRAAKIGPIGMADIGVAYFGGTAVCLLVAGFVPERGAALGLLSWLAVLALPYTIFSIGYQALVVKRFCPLCVAVQAILWCQAAWVLGQFGFPGTLRGLRSLVSPESAAVLIVGYGMTTFAWSYAKPLLRRSKELSRIRAKVARLERSPTVIRAQISEQPAVALPELPLEIVEGASRPRLTITVYTEAHCPYCGNAHAELAPLLAEFGDEVAVRFRLVAGAESPGWKRVSEHIAQALVDRDQGRAGHLLARWYAARRSNGEVELPALELAPEAKALLARHAAAAPPFPNVPMIFVDSRRLPDTVELNVLRYLVRGLKDAAAHADGQPHEESSAR